ncbi:hypothetical protein CERZMDRAFT_101572 [Cercospora zeae-maydis SCOH1-5]|uniref:Uncharacterized protein n=1 Tax=Cercospora zeae-maydis SCOH1-5 TaxID=717836 RepID=A0A6A6F7E1_9PEZI|nr:hypothetical protein CERZMDRAFT_101572 [Cercospora zeae-maydis SCOH1-5]
METVKDADHPISDSNRRSPPKTPRSKYCHESSLNHGPGSMDKSLLTSDESRYNRVHDGLGPELSIESCGGSMRHVTVHAGQEGVKHRRRSAHQHVSSGPVRVVSNSNESAVSEGNAHPGLAESQTEAQRMEAGCGVEEGGSLSRS